MKRNPVKNDDDFFIIHKEFMCNLDNEKEIENELKKLKSKNKELQEINDNLHVKINKMQQNINIKDTLVNENKTKLINLNRNYNLSNQNISSLETQIDKLNNYNSKLNNIIEQSNNVDSQFVESILSEFCDVTIAINTNTAKYKLVNKETNKVIIDEKNINYFSSHKLNRDCYYEIIISGDRVYNADLVIIGTGLNIQITGLTGNNSKILIPFLVPGKNLF